MNPLAIIGAVAIGLSLGLTGAGGSILTLPVLVFLAGVPPREAVGISLFVVGAAAFAGAAQRIRDLHVRAVVVFGVAGMAGAAVGSHFTAWLPPMVLMGLFAGLMLWVGIRMLLVPVDAADPAPDCRFLRCAVAGAGTGVITGFLGVGGGFLLTPALMRFARLPMRAATATSLAVIGTNSAIGWISHGAFAGGHQAVAWTFAGLAIAGTLIGTRVAAALPTGRLRQGFAVLVLWQCLPR